jgi:hypothetical protein
MQEFILKHNFFHFKLSMLPSQTSVLHHKLLFMKNMLIKLCVGNYVRLNGLVNNANDTFQIYKKFLQNHYYK